MSQDQRQVMRVALEPGLIKDIKQATKYLKESIEESPTDKKLIMQVGVVLNPIAGLDKSQAITLLNKFAQALACFQEDAVAGMSLQGQLEHDNSDWKAIMDCTQKKLEASQLLVKGSSDVKAATPDQIQAVSEDTAVQKAAGELKT